MERQVDEQRRLELADLLVQRPAEQLLEAMLDTMTRFVLPVIPADERFAQEQAGLIMATLGWLVDVNEFQHAYEVAEHADHRALGVALLELADDADLRAAVEDDLPEGATLEQLRARTRTLKALTAAVLESAGDAAEVSRLFLQVADRPAEREQSWCRMTGMPRDAGDFISLQEMSRRHGRRWATCPRG